MPAGKNIDKQLNQESANMCDWFVDNILNIHFGDDKPKSNLFTSKRDTKKVPKFQRMKIKFSVVLKVTEVVEYPTKY